MVIEATVVEMTEEMTVEMTVAMIDADQEVLEETVVLVLQEMIVIVAEVVIGIVVMTDLQGTTEEGMVVIRIDVTTNEILRTVIEVRVAAHVTETTRTTMVLKMRPKILRTIKAARLHQTSKKNDSLCD